MKISPFAILASVALTISAGLHPALAQDASTGEAEFKNCKACHMITAPNGTQIMRGGRVGPNLYGVVGRKIGSQQGFRYRDGLQKLHDDGAVWTEKNLIAYMTDPRAWVADKTGKSTGMIHKQPDHQADIVAYLKSVAQ